MGFLVTPMVKKKKSLQCGIPGFNPWIRQIPWRREQLATPIFLPGESHRQRNLVGYQSTGLYYLSSEYSNFLITSNLMVSLECETLHVKTKHINIFFLLHHFQPPPSISSYHLKEYFTFIYVTPHLLSNYSDSCPQNPLKPFHINLLPILSTWHFNTYLMSLSSLPL